MTAHALPHRGTAFPALRFEPAPVLPAQLLAGARAGTPARRLMLAVLADATADFQRYVQAVDARGRRRFREAAAWFWSPRCDHPFAFVSVCDALDLDPAYLRKGLRRWAATRAGHGHGVPPTPRRIFFDRGVAPGARIGGSRLPAAS